MSSIRKRGNHYQAQIRMSGGRARSATFKTRAEALAWVREAAFELSQLPASRDERITIAEVIERYIKDVIPLRGSGKIEAQRLSMITRQPLASLRITSISKSDLSRYRDSRLQLVKTNTLVREMGLLRSVLATAIDDWGLNVPNPLSDFRIKREPDQRFRRLGQGELEKLLTTHCGNPFTKPAALLSLETAMRLGEILSIEWCHLDHQNGFVELKRSKNGYGRIIPLTETAIGVIEELCRDGDLLFPVKPDTLKLSWRRLVRRAGIQDLRFHDLRHEAISRLLEKGLTIPEAASVSGHRTASMLMRYAHPDARKVREKMMQ